MANNTTRRTIDPPVIEHQGTSIILPGDPKPMDLSDAISWLQKMQKDQETYITVNETIDVYPWDGARAFSIAIREMFGFAQMKGWNPQQITIATDVDQTESIPWGAFAVPGIQGTLYTGSTRNSNGQLVFSVSAEVLKKHAPQVRELLAKTRDVLKIDSIYKGKAIRFSVDAKGDAKVPEFIDLSRVNPAELVYTQDIADQVDVTVFAPLRRREWCKALGIPFKRGVCLIGSYGVGKTLAVYVAAQHAKHAGITAIVVEDAEKLPDAMLLARQYAPSVLIVEDIDRVTRERDDLCNDIMDALDGVEAKESDVMVLFTSNNADHIHEAMRRPGRIDTFIRIDPPDASAVDRLLRLYGRGRIAIDENLSDVSTLLAGQIPAVIREVVERAKLAAVARAATLEDAMQITSSDLSVAARRLLMQQTLFNPKTDTTGDAEKALAAFGKHVLTPALNDLGRAPIMAAARRMN